MDRKSLFVALVKLPKGKAETVAECFTKIFKRLDSERSLSMTFEHGFELSKRETLTKITESY